MLLLKRRKIMRITVHLPENLGEQIKMLARDEGVSVSRFVAKSLEQYLVENRRRKHAQKILNLAGRVRVSDEALKTLEEGRLEDRT
jgi:antitoxin VapB